jgi:hypothetical protein
MYCVADVLRMYCGCIADRQVVTWRQKKDAVILNEESAMLKTASS